MSVSQDAPVSPGAGARAQSTRGSWSFMDGVCDNSLDIGCLLCTAITRICQRARGQSIHGTEAKALSAI